jgi:hypothetical protein
MSKYILFPNIGVDYGTKLYSRVRIGMRMGGVGEYPDAEADKYISNGAQEIDEQEFNLLKKKATSGAGSYRPFFAEQKDASKNPNAVYAESPAPSKEPEPEKVESLLEVAETETEVEVKEVQPPKARRKGKKK